MYVMQSEVCCEIVYVACEPYSVYAAEKGGVRRLQIDVYQLHVVTESRLGNNSDIQSQPSQVYLNLTCNTGVEGGRKTSFIYKHSMPSDSKHTSSETMCWYDSMGIAIVQSGCSMYHVDCGEYKLEYFLLQLRLLDCFHFKTKACISCGNRRLLWETVHENKTEQ